MGLFDKAYDFTEAKKIRKMGLYPYFRIIESDQDTKVTIKGKKVVMLGSNSYLGLTNHPKVKEAAIEAIRKYGTGCAGSRFLNGTFAIHVETEELLAKFMGKEAALLYSTGFQTNQGAIAPLVGRGEYVVADKLVHASIIEGCRLAFGRFLKFDHNDMSDLEKTLKTCRPDKGKLIVVDGVYSMEGDLANLPEICALAEKYGAEVMVDDAHGLGVFGKNGRGTCDHFGVSEKVSLIMGTFSKSFASLGGFIASDADVIDFLRHFSRALMFSASMPPANVAAVKASLEIMQSEPERIEKLWHNTKMMAEGLKSAGFNLNRSESPIIPILVGDDLTVFKMCRVLFEEGVFVNPVVSPAVEPGKAIIRVSLMATHTDEEINYALDKLKTVGQKMGIIN